jgi:RNA polymerase sigma-70 factor (ECF subfamily)
MTTPLPPGRAAWLAANILPHEPALRGWLARRGVNGGDVDDLVQEGYAVLAAMTDVAHIDSPKAYLFRTAWSLMLRQVRRAQVVSIEAVADLASLDIEADAPDPERQLGSRQELRRLATAIDSLPPRCRDVFRLRKVEGLSQREVAARTGLSESTVEKHVGKAVRLLGQWLASDDAAAGDRMRATIPPRTIEANDRA